MNLKEILKRAETGPILEANDFLMQRVAMNVAKLQKKYNIRWDGKSLVNLDDDLADRCWEAGKELLLTAGLYSANSRRVIEFSAEEVEQALRFAPSRLVMGEGKDAVEISHRAVEDTRRPFIFSGPFNSDVHESLFVRLNEAFAQ
ncbi:MAG: monomethylamine:corrinoid methyltransferase, partial [Candidatus Hadarchaeum sp.]